MNCGPPARGGHTALRRWRPATRARPGRKDAGARGGALGIAGGDGTVNAAAVLAAEGGLPLAVFPAGTLNHFATDLGLPTLKSTADSLEAGCGGTVGPGRVTVDGGAGGRPQHVRAMRHPITGEILPDLNLVFQKGGVEFAPVAARPEISGRAATAAVTRGCGQPRRYW
ncbi:diacylglycerol kinase family protein [Streptomyces sp. NBC_00885]|uniref:diacylglycerol kinase family protein n=1 Tax=Streptomyces sp. NBC_00885 TaxID=2975857 RepID=UPI0038703D8B|nr:diacylglycerol kinase family protein [Streptomyces sp. NBC_00885]